MNKRKRGAAQLAGWLIIGAATLVFLKWQNDDIDAVSIVPVPFILDSATVPRRLDSIPRPFARLKAPVALAPRKNPAPPLPTKLRAEPGQPVPVSITAYCLKGRTRMGTGVREGVIAAKAAHEIAGVALNAANETNTKIADLNQRIADTIAPREQHDDTQKTVHESNDILGTLVEKQTP